MSRQPIQLTPSAPGVSTSPAVKHMAFQPPKLSTRKSADQDAIDEVAMDLVQFALDLAGIFDPTPLSDGSSALISLARGQWFNALISGVSMVPYIGDLAKAGKLPVYLKSIERAVELAEKSKAAMKALLPGFIKLEAVLELIPTGANKYIDSIRTKVKYIVGLDKLEKVLPDISKLFRFRTYELNDKIYKEASGKLGVPGKVLRHRSKSAQGAVSAGTGDDAGHLIGDRFGAPGDGLNLSAQNHKLNRGWPEGNKPDWSKFPDNGAGFKSGGFKGLEDEWAEKLEKGTGIDVTVTDITKKGEDRPFERRVEWKETAPDGEVTKNSRVFMNTHTEQSRAARGIPLKVNGPQQNNVVDLAAERLKRQ